MESKHIALKKLANDVKYKREVMELKSLRGLAKEINLSISTISRVENEQIPELETYCILCDWLGVPITRYKIFN